MARTALVTVLGLLIGVALGLLVVRGGVLRDALPAPAAEAPATTSAGSPVLAPLMEGEHSRFAVLARDAAAGVVNVQTSKTVSRTPQGFLIPEIFRDFFGGPGGPSVPEPRERSFTVPSLGTGFILTAEGDIVTNNHVVDGVDEITVRFSDGSELPATVVGQDPKTDIALIRVQGRTDLRPLPLGDSDAILPGDWVVAIGNPYGLEHTVTVGIVSAKGRELGLGPYDDFIQTDAAINPGNSGGPLLDLHGRVVGINTAINPRANTIGFAVPINLAKQIVPQLQQQGHVTRGWLGVLVQPLTAEIAQALELDTRTGALVSQITPGSPAEAAGLQRGDLVVRYGDQAVDDYRDLARAVSATPVGEEVDVEVIRNGEHETVKVTIGELEEPQLAARQPMHRSGAAAFGLGVQPLTPALRERLGVDVEEGVVISEIDPTGPSAEAGLQPGDVVLEVDREPVRSVEEFSARLNDAGARALLLIQRHEASMFVSVQRGEGEG